jgi:endogenous inhibitor of DNA gyrase (YacG/DUF329 family)
LPRWSQVKASGTCRDDDVQEEGQIMFTTFMDFFPPWAANEQRPPQHAYPCPVCERTVVVRNGTDQFSLLGYRVNCPNCSARLQLTTDQNGLIALAPLASEERYAGEWA